ncbi:MAG: hypothetical protein GY866_03025, partial [Proteobacteria bacterium]|nr:hypothetical protein [Pseudomonadota bacterium]
MDSVKTDKGRRHANLLANRNDSMEISLAGIEEALEGLGYRETSPKARLIRTIHTFYKNSALPNEVCSIDGDQVIDRMWDLGGDGRAIRSKRKNLSSIKSSVNQDLDAAWAEGRNPEGITIGPLNAFVISDAAKDKILNSFTGSMNLEGGKSIEQVSEALKIVSDYLSEMPADVEGEQLTNLKSMIEGLSEKFRNGGDGEVKIVERTVNGSGIEGGDGGSIKEAEEKSEGQGDEGESELETTSSEVDGETGNLLEPDTTTEGGEGEGLDGVETEDVDDLDIVDDDGGIGEDAAEEGAEVEIEDADDVEMVDEEEVAEGIGDGAEDEEGIEGESEEDPDDVVEVVDEDEIGEDEDGDLVEIDEDAAEEGAEVEIEDADDVEM